MILLEFRPPLVLVVNLAPSLYDILRLRRLLDVSCVGKTVQTVSSLLVIDDYGGWEPVLRSMEVDRRLGVSLHVRRSSQYSRDTCFRDDVIGLGRAVDDSLAEIVLPWLVKLRTASRDSFVFLLASPTLRPWFPLWWEAGVTWIATEKHQVETLYKLIARVARLRTPIKRDTVHWHEVEAGNLPWHNTI